MAQGIELTGALAFVVLLLPFLLLAMLYRGTRGAHRPPPADRSAQPTVGAVAPAPILLRGADPGVTASPPQATAAAGPAPTPVQASPQPATPTPTEAQAPAAAARVEPVAADEPAAEDEPPPPDPLDVARERIGVLVPEIKAALSAGRNEDAVRLLIEEASCLTVLGTLGPAAERLRQSIRLAATHGMKPEHALARLELGDLASREGDLTTACEHWSMARGLMHELKLVDGIKQTEARIRNNGCPTDWVLNDF